MQSSLFKPPPPSYQYLVSLKQTLLTWMKGGDGSFPEIALEVFTHQFSENPPYRNYCESLGKNPDNVNSWLEIPAIPTDTFKLKDISLRCFPESEVSGFFLTSGTTQEIKGKHEHRSLDLYKASVHGSWREMKLPEIQNPWFFSPRLTAAPHSSLVQMFEFLDTGGHWLTAGTLPPQNQPAAILGTSLALLKACEEMPTTTLPEGSWIFETGGSKGLKKSHSPEEVRETLSAHFSIPNSRILNEYSMTELSSQFYKWGHEITHKGPPWTAIRILDVETGSPAPLGKIGYLEILDLANLETVSAIRTQDLAIAHGQREFQLLGRDPAATARGCSRVQ